MNINVKLFGGLGGHLPGYDQMQGIQLALPDGTRVKDLIAHLEIPGSRGFIAAAKGSLLKPDDVLENGTSVQIFQSVFGG